MIKTLAKRVGNPQESKEGKTDLLLRFFNSQFFDERMLLQYLYQNTQDGVHDFLCNRLYELSEEKLERYLLQLVYLAVSRPASPLERTIIDLCSKKFRVAVKVNWLLTALLQDNPKNRDVEVFRSKCADAAMDGVWEVPFRDPHLDPLSPRGALSPARSPPFSPESSAIFAHFNNHVSDSLAAPSRRLSPTTQAPGDMAMISSPPNGRFAAPLTGEAAKAVAAAAGSGEGDVQSLTGNPAANGYGIDESWIHMSADGHNGFARDGSNSSSSSGLVVTGGGMGTRGLFPSMLSLVKIPEALEHFGAAPWRSNSLSVDLNCLPSLEQRGLSLTAAQVQSMQAQSMQAQSMQAEATSQLQRRRSSSSSGQVMPASAAPPGLLAAAATPSSQPSQPVAVVPPRKAVAASEAASVAAKAHAPSPSPMSEQVKQRHAQLQVQAQPGANCSGGGGSPQHAKSLNVERISELRQELGDGEGVTALLQNSKAGNGPIAASEDDVLFGDDPGRPLSPTQRLRHDTYGATLDFVDALCDASSTLTTFSQEERHRALRMALETINCEIETANRRAVAIWFPMGSSSSYERVIRLTAKEAVLLNSREKAPFMLFVEVLQPEENITEAPGAVSAKAPHLPGTKTSRIATIQCEDSAARITDGGRAGSHNRGPSNDSAYTSELHSPACSSPQHDQLAHGAHPNGIHYVDTYATKPDPASGSTSHAVANHTQSRRTAAHTTIPVDTSTNGSKGAVGAAHMAPPAALPPPHPPPSQLPLSQLGPVIIPARSNSAARLYADASVAAAAAAAGRAANATSAPSNASSTGAPPPAVSVSAGHPPLDLATTAAVTSNAGSALVLTSKSQPMQSTVYQAQAQQPALVQPVLPMSATKKRLPVFEKDGGFSGVVRSLCFTEPSVDIQNLPPALRVPGEWTNEEVADLMASGCLSPPPVRPDKGLEDRLASVTASLRGEAPMIRLRLTYLPTPEQPASSSSSAPPATATASGPRSTSSSGGGAPFTALGGLSSSSNAVRSSTSGIFANAATSCNGFAVHSPGGAEASMIETLSGGSSGRGGHSSSAPSLAPGDATDASRRRGSLESASASASASLSASANFFTYGCSIAAAAVAAAAGSVSAVGGGSSSSSAHAAAVPAPTSSSSSSFFGGAAGGFGAGGTSPVFGSSSAHASLATAGSNTGLASSMSGDGVLSNGSTAGSGGNKKPSLLSKFSLRRKGTSEAELGAAALLATGPAKVERLVAVKLEVLAGLNLHIPSPYRKSRRTPSHEAINLVAGKYRIQQIAAPYECGPPLNPSDSQLSFGPEMSFSSSTRPSLPTITSPPSRPPISPPIVHSPSPVPASSTSWGFRMPSLSILAGAASAIAAAVDLGRPSLSSQPPLNQQNSQNQQVSPRGASWFGSNSVNGGTISPSASDLRSASSSRVVSGSGYDVANNARAGSGGGAAAAGSGGGVRASGNGAPLSHAAPPSLQSSRGCSSSQQHLGTPATSSTAVTATVTVGRRAQPGAQLPSAPTSQQRGTAPSMPSQGEAPNSSPAMTAATADAVTASSYSPVPIPAAPDSPSQMSPTSAISQGPAPNVFPFMQAHYGSSTAGTPTFPSSPVRSPYAKQPSSSLSSALAVGSRGGSSSTGTTTSGFSLMHSAIVVPRSLPESVAERCCKEACAVYGERWAAKEARIRRETPQGRRKGWALRCAIVKSGDDCRQELLAMQLICTFHDIFREAQLTLWVRPYEVLVTSNRTALIEMIPDSLSIHTVKARSPPGTSLSDHFFAKFIRGSPRCDAAQRKFTESLAAYSIICYLLQIKDRHNGNIMIDDEGHIIHIDFGFMLSNSPGGVNFEGAPFKLTREFLEVMDSTSEGRASEMFDYYKVLVIQGFLAARKHHERIVQLVKMMSKSGYPCFKAGPERTVKALERRFVLGQTEQGSVGHVLSLISDSLDAWRTRQYDYYQRVLNGIL